MRQFTVQQHMPIRACRACIRADGGARACVLGDPATARLKKHGAHVKGARQGRAGMSAEALDIDWVGLLVMDPPTLEWGPGTAAGHLA